MCSSPSPKPRPHASSAMSLPFGAHRTATTAIVARSDTRSGGEVAKRQNYGFQKRQKETDKQKKREEKAEKKRARKEAGETAPPEGGTEIGKEDD